MRQLDVFVVSCMHASFTIRPICKFIKFYSFIHIHLKNFDKTQSNIDASNSGDGSLWRWKEFSGGGPGRGGMGMKLCGDGWGWNWNLRRWVGTCAISVPVPISNWNEWKSVTIQHNVWQTNYITRPQRTDKKEFSVFKTTTTQQCCTLINPSAWFIPSFIGRQSSLTIDIS